MTKRTKLKVNFIILIIPVIIFYIINYFVSFNTNDDLNQISNSVNLETTEESNISNENQDNSQDVDENITLQDEVNTNTEEEKENNQNSPPKEFEWQIEIPAISLKAEIKQGTEKKVMNQYVGHFTETSITNGNVGLAAHNRGYAVNYFANLKKLKINDQIIYKYRDYKKTYFVEEIKVIKDTDWTYLEETDKNVITLITCVENEPEYRRCIRGVERK